MIDIPRIFTISESEHRIHNPFTARLSPARHGKLRRTEGLKVVGSAS